MFKSISDNNIDDDKDVVDDCDNVDDEIVNHLYNVECENVDDYNVEDDNK